MDDSRLPKLRTRRQRLAISSASARSINVEEQRKLISADSVDLHLVAKFASQAVDRRDQHPVSAQVTGSDVDAFELVEIGEHQRGATLVRFSRRRQLDRVCEILSKGVNIRGLRQRIKAR